MMSCSRGATAIGSTASPRRWVCPASRSALMSRRPSANSSELQPRDPRRRPFATTFRPMLEACSVEAVPYLDLNGELDVFRAMEEFVDHQQPTIPFISGVGFGVVAGESAAMHAVSMLRQPQRFGWASCRMIADPATGTIATNQPAPEGARPRNLGFANATWGGVEWSTLPGKS